MAGNVTIAEAIKQLRVQLEDAQRDSSGKDLRFLTRSIEVELAVVFKTEIEGGVGVKAWFLDISGKAKDSDETSHKVKLVLEPIGRDGKPTQVSDKVHEKE
jgi:Trypsin-co-occurring domain 2